MLCSRLGTMLQQIDQLSFPGLSLESFAGIHPDETHRKGPEDAHGSDRCENPQLYSPSSSPERHTSDMCPRQLRAGRQTRNSCNMRQARHEEAS